MSDLFTVKLDLSAVLQDDSEPEFYILMVDTRNTKMIYEFKMWIRFLFSFDAPIQLVYDGAVIHDLENVKILSLLKIIQVKRVDSPDGGQQQQQKLLEQLHKYDEWCKNSSHLQSPGKIDPVSSLGSYTMIQITDGVPNCSPSKNNHSPGKKNTVMPSNNEASEGHESNSFITSKNKIPETDDCKTQTIVKVKSISNNLHKRRLVHKPFYLGDVLKLLRNEEVQSDKEDRIGQPSENESVKNSPNCKELENVCEYNNGELMVNFEKKQKKRIRKHKSKKKGPVCDMSKPPFMSHNLFTSFNDDGVQKSPEKPKHIRFDSSKDDMEYEVSCIDPTPKQDCVFSRFSEENKNCNLSLQQLKEIVEKKKRSITNCLNEGANEKVNVSLNECQERRSPENLGMTDSDENNLKILASDHGRKTDDFNYDVLHALQSMRYQNDKPLVFKRFN